jgi:hypothetical protein
MTKQTTTRSGGPSSVAGQTALASSPAVGSAGTRRRTRSQIGKANNAKGKKAERDLVRYLRENGWPDAIRIVRTGIKSGQRITRDEGDIGKTPGIAWQMKAVDEKKWSQIPAWLVDAADQAVETGADLGVLVLRRPGHAQPGDWWAWVELSDVVGLHDRASGADSYADARVPSFPVRCQLAHLVGLLHAAGYGQVAGQEAGA